MTTNSLARGAITSIRVALAISGVLSLIVGALILLWPGRTAEVVTAIIAVYVILGGLIYAAVGVFSRSAGGWARVGHIALGVLFVVAGVVAFVNLTAAALSLAIFLGLLVGVLWIVEGVVALSTLSDSSSRGWSIFFAVVSILAGIVLLFSPLLGAVVLWWLLGISLVVLGAFQLVRAFTFGKTR